MEEYTNEHSIKYKDLIVNTKFWFLAYQLIDEESCVQASTSISKNKRAKV